MLHIALLILKILGILFLVLLGLLAVVLLLVLFVPVRYRLNADFHGKPIAKLEIGWLLGALRASISYEETAVLRIQALWHCFVRKQLWPLEETGPEEFDDISDEEPVSEVFHIRSGDALEETLSGEGAEDVWKKDSAGEAFEVGPEGEPDGDDFEESMDLPLEAFLEEETAKEESSDDMLLQAQETELSGIQRDREDQAVHILFPKEEEGAGETASQQSDPGRIFRAAADVLLKGKEKAAEFFRHTQEKAKDARHKINKILAFFKDEGNQRAMAFLLSRAGKLIRHVLPGKIRGHIRYGFEDPYQTGQVLTLISPFYGLYAKTLVIEPVFDEKVIEGEIFIRGRVRAAVLAGAGLRILLNKDSRRFLKKLIRLFR